MAFLPLRFTVSAKRRWLAGAIISVALSVLLFAQSAPPVKEAELCSISGIVVDSINGAPIGKADIWLEPFQPQSSAEFRAAERPETMSGADGRFQMLSIQPGRYQLRAIRSGYLEAPYGAFRPRSDGTALDLRAGKRLTDLTIRLAPGGVISGIVRDSDGEALEGARVILARSTYETGFPILRRISTTLTDDLGGYRLNGLEEGTYYVAVAGRDGYGRVDRSGASGTSEAEVLTAYPGVTDLGQATPIEIVPGQRVQGVNVNVARAPVFRVRGRMENAPANGAGYVELSDAKYPGLRSPQQVPPKKGTGEFEFSGIPPGSYYLGPNLGNVPVVVNGADVDGLRIGFQPPSTIENLRAIGDQPFKTNPPDLAIQISKANLKYAHSFSTGQAQGGGGGAANGLRRGIRVEPGEYMVIGFSGNELRQFYVKSAHASGTDILSQNLTLSRGASVEITVALASDGAKVEGIVRGQKDEPAPHSTVLLAPDSRDRMYLFRTATTDEQGRYEFPAVPPGKYRIFAWHNPEPGIWFAPGYLKRYESQGQEVMLEPKESRVIELRLAVKPEA